jgi:hypothetical protein
MNLTTFYPILRSLGGGKAKPRSLEEARQWAGRMVRGEGRRYKTLEAAFEMLAIPTELRQQILKRWKDAGRPALEEFAPYVAYVLTIDLFFYLSLGSGFITSQRPSNRVDVAYLYYLPFCRIFTSGDRLHQKITPFLLRKDQEFLWAPELKADLARLDAYYDALPESVKAEGIMRFALRPPTEGGYLTTKLWDKFLPTWRELHVPASDATRAKAQAYAKALSDPKALPEKSQQSSQADLARPHDPIALERHIHARKGKWQVIPPEVVMSGVRVESVRRRSD